MLSCKRPRGRKRLDFPPLLCRGLRRRSGPTEEREETPWLTTASSLTAARERFLLNLKSSGGAAAAEAEALAGNFLPSSYC
jgi:hypothetical protein